jgi:hypothetical protein
LVYPFTLESHVLPVGAWRRATKAAHVARREVYLSTREDEKERRKREALRRIAPGFEPQAAPLVPVKLDAGTNAATQASAQTRDVMDDLVDKLAALESDPQRHLQ